MAAAIAAAQELGVGVVNEGDPASFDMGGQEMSE
jgi:hypothetical protein